MSVLVNFLLAISLGKFGRMVNTENIYAVPE